MIMIVKTPASHKGSPAAAEEGAEGREEGRGEGGERKVYYKIATNRGKQ